ncbi:hypothetical protein CC1G_10390 [Coprinopsis cinerea okayama7|uniref:Uncharacterized protein n=1 Tax=Coprinopsis cinerea (strain Okayama-7 / 130 / ATCC MYA-4618 / FGSC 9003) TaxID=240176 RepID=A8PAL5_COPC7|nr:hypothetical protein CC1G_10390 [Coprinopsis cinerea okayama7\|eukprot:XP_001840006.1 hypothetical protein CC1G_10390 [Coprinopsis cinerea okayama7\
MATLPTEDPSIAAFVHAPKNTLLRLDPSGPPIAVDVVLDYNQLRETLLVIDTSTTDYVLTVSRADWTHDKFNSVFEPWLSPNGCHGPMFNLEDMAKSPEYCEAVLRGGGESFLETLPDELHDFQERVFGRPRVRVCLGFFGRPSLSIFCDDDERSEMGLCTKGWMAWRIASMAFRAMEEFVVEKEEFRGFQPGRFRILGMLHLLKKKVSVPVLVYSLRRV